MLAENEFFSQKKLTSHDIFFHLFCIFYIFFSKQEVEEEKLPFETFFVKIGQDIFEIFDFEPFLKSSSVKMHTRFKKNEKALKRFTYPYSGPQVLSYELSNRLILIAVKNALLRCSRVAPIKTASHYPLYCEVLF